MILGNYITLFDIGVEHDFFEGPSRCLDFVPTEKTKRLIHNHGMLIRKTSSGILVAYDHGRFEALQIHMADDSDGLEFEFKAYATDPGFHTYTKLVSELGKKLLYFENTTVSNHVEEVVSLHESEHVSSNDLIDMDSNQLKGVINKKDYLIPPVLVLRILASGNTNGLFDKDFNNKSPSFRINFDSRQTYWKYYLDDSDIDDSTYVYDPDEKIAFESTGAVELPDGRKFSTYRSKKSIQLHERYDFKFQLKQKQNGDDKVLFRRLPFAGTGLTEKEVVADQAIEVSEIFVTY